MNDWFGNIEVIRTGAPWMIVRVRYPWLVRYQCALLAQMLSE